MNINYIFTTKQRVWKLQDEELGQIDISNQTFDHFNLQNQT
jgi:hypothetical protein